MSIAQTVNQGVTAVFLVFLTLVCLSHVRNHFKHLKYKEAQLWCIPMLTMPFILGWLYWGIVYDVHEYKTLVFFTLLFKSIMGLCFLKYLEKLIGWDYLDGKHYYNKSKLMEILATLEKWNKFFKWITCGGSERRAKIFLILVRIATYQFPIFLFALAIVAITIALLDEPSLYTTFQICQGASALIAMIGVFLLVKSIENIPVLHGISINHKTIWLEFGIMLTSIQTAFIILSTKLGAIGGSGKYSDAEIVLYTESLLVCFEMVILGFLQIYIFPVSDFSSTPSGRIENYEALKALPEK